MRGEGKFPLIVGIFPVRSAIPEQCPLSNIPLFAEANLPRVREFRNRLQRKPDPAPLRYGLSVVRELLNYFAQRML